MESLSPSQGQALAKYLDEQVFNTKLEDDGAEYERQRLFNEAKQRELRERASSVTNASFAHQDFTNLPKHSRHKRGEEATSISQD